ncbi:hypothetical protein MMC10_007818 [Thelotrema lepadinum]|nr:hypothetical protein [Thelotrema lepadinum]
MTGKSVRVAVVQAEPAWLDLAESVKKTCALIADAANEGASLVAFPECWVPGYPTWIWSRPVDSKLAIEYIQNSLGIDSAEMRAICQCAAENKIVVVLGLSERDGSSLYIAQCTIDENGEIRMRRRKLKPTHMERTVFGDSSGGSLVNVVPLDVGKIGALSCWEHIQPLLKYNTYQQGEEIHVAGWPPVYPHKGNSSLWSISAEGSVLTQKGIDRMETGSGNMFETPGGGASAIIAPDGKKIAGDLGAVEEGLVLADLDMNMILGAKSFVDVCGHYSRPDMLWLGIDTRDRKRVVNYDEKIEALP